jgi:hypothetical protein
MTEQDAAILSSFVGHPALTILWSSESWDLIVDWFNEVPDPKLSEIIGYLSLLDRAKFFSYVNFQDWYSQFNLNLHNGGGVPVMGFSVDEVKLFSSRLLTDLLGYGLIEHSMQSLITEMFSRKTQSTAFYFLVCLGCDEILEQKTLSLLGIELGGVERWKSAGLSAPITPEDCESVFT